jgi:hypothetical protein
MFRNVLGLSGFQLLKPALIAIDRCEAMAHLVGPEIQIGDMTGQLMPIESDESRNLVAD